VSAMRCSFRQNHLPRLPSIQSPRRLADWPRRRRRHHQQRNPRTLAEDDRFRNMSSAPSKRGFIALGWENTTLVAPQIERPGLARAFPHFAGSTPASPGTPQSAAFPHQCFASSPGTTTECARSFRTPRPAPSPRAPRATIASPVPSPTSHRPCR
jgi:hypothetical protein